MAFELNHDSARKLAKALSARTGREIKLKDIYSDIGCIFGMKGDAMMHALKNAVGTSPANGAKDTGRTTDFDPELGLSTLPYFMRCVLHEIEDRNHWDVAICVVHVASVETVRQRHGDAAAAAHLREFAALLRPLMISDSIHCYLEGTFFAAAWPKLDTEIDAEKRILARMNGWARDLEERRLERGLGDDFRHEFAGSGFLTDNLSLDAADIQRFLEKGRVHAVNRVAARRELAAFPLFRFD